MGTCSLGEDRSCEQATEEAGLTGHSCSLRGKKPRNWLQGCGTRVWCRRETDAGELETNGSITLEVSVGARAWHVALSLVNHREALVGL